MRRRILYASGLLVLLTLTATLTWMFWPRPHLAQESFAKVRTGMTLGEIEAIVGGPPGVYCSGHASGSYWAASRPAEEALRASKTCEWVGEDVSLCVFFDASGRANWAIHGPTMRADGLLDKIRAWIGFPRPEPRETTIIEMTPS